LIGFVLRSTPFYSTIHRLLRDDAIGRICSIQADELPGWSVSSIMNRSPWRRFTARSGGSMLEKSCHDMDVLNWMMGCRPLSLCSYGDSLIFRANASLPDTCEKCRLGSDCRYYKQPKLASQEDSAEADLHRFIREDNRCIYNIEKDVIDVQNIAIQYENGAVANFMLNFNTAGEKAGRNFHAVGLKGRIWGNLQEKAVFLYDNRSGELSRFDASGDGSGHGGGNRIHALELHRMMADPEYRPEQSASAGYLSAVMCFAADKSRVERRRVDFRYTEDDRISLV
jgi:predicted dehydrogenase